MRSLLSKSALRSEEGRIDGIQRIHNGSEDGVSLCVLPSLSGQDFRFTLPKVGEHFFVCATIAFSVFHLSIIPQVDALGNSYLMFFGMIVLSLVLTRV